MVVSWEVIWEGVGWLDMDAAAARSWAALATRPAVVRVLNLGFGGGLGGIVARDGLWDVGWWDALSEAQ